MRINCPGIRIILVFLLVVGPMAATINGFSSLLRALHIPVPGPADREVLTEVFYLLYAAIALLLIRGKADFSLLVRRWFFDPYFLRKLLLGFGIGTGIVLIVTFILYRTHHYGIDSINWDYSLPYNLILFGFVAVEEEVLFRGYLFQEFQKATVPAVLLLSSGIFALVHLIDPGQHLTIKAAALILAYTFSGGLVYGLAYSLSRSLWMPMGLHLAFDTIDSMFLGDADDKNTTLFRSYSDHPAVVAVLSLTFLFVASLFWVLLWNRRKDEKAKMKDSLLINAKNASKNDALIGIKKRA